MNYRSKSGLFSVIGLMLALLAGCVGKVPHPGPDENPDLMFRESYSIPALYLKWLERFDRIRIAESLTLRLVARESMQVRLDLVTQGLDARTVERPLREVTVSPKRPLDLVVKLADLPMQSLSYSATASVKATAIRADGSLLTVHSPPVYNHFSRDFRQVYVYDFDTMQRELGGGRLAVDIFDLNGRVLQEGRYVDINEIRRKQYNNDPPQQTGPIIDYAVDTGLPDIGPIGDTGHPVCVRWQTRYLDAGHGEDAAASPGSQLLNAAYAEVQIRRPKFEGNLCIGSVTDTNLAESCTELVWHGILNEQGCTRLHQEAEDKTYFVFLYSRIKRGTRDAEISYYDNNDKNLGIQRWIMSFTLPAQGSPPSFSLPIAQWHPTANATAVMSQLFSAGDLVAPGSYFDVRANKGCPTNNPDIPPDDACAPGPTFYTGPWTRSVDGSPGHLQSKYVIAHEAGHIIQDQATGIPSNPYNVSIPPSMHECRCDHVVSSNQLHCLQSGEQTSTGQVEGFAQFVAARAFNSPSQSDCRFNYYKEFLHPDQSVSLPPVNTDCKTAVQWRDSFCFYPNVGTEFDWMQFYWNLNTAAVNRIHMQELYAIYAAACPNGNCNGINVTWETLRAGAEAFYGSTNHPKYELFVNYGEQFAVDADQ